MVRALGVALLILAGVGGSAQDAPGRSSAAALVLTASSSPAGVVQGSDVTITVTVQNTGDAPATGVEVFVQFAAPAALANVRVSSSDLSCGTFQIRCTAASLAAGASATATIVATAVGDPGTSLNTLVSGSAAGLSVPSTSANSFIALPPSNISVSESASAVSAPPGSAMSFSVSVANSGADRAGFWLVFHLGPGAWSVTQTTQASGPAFSCATDQYHAECSIGTFAAGASASFSFAVTVGADAQPGVVLNSRAFAFQGAPNGTALASDARSLTVASPVSPPPGGGGGGSGGGETAVLTVTVSGPGSVSGGGIACPPTCSTSVAKGTRVELRATPTSTSAFQQWSGACTGSGTTCSVVVDAATSVGAAFGVTAAPDPPPPPATAPRCRVPALVGRTLVQARAALTARRCKLGRITRVGSRRLPGRIVTQALRAGLTRPVGTRVNVTVSRGPG